MHVETRDRPNTLKCMSAENGLGVFRTFERLGMAENHLGKKYGNGGIWVPTKGKRGMLCL